MTRETSKPIPEKIAMETNGLLSDFSDEADDAGICAEMREAFGMSGAPIHKSKTPPTDMLSGCYDEGSTSGAEFKFSSRG